MLAFWIEADAFMRHMNRVLVGTMLEVAGGRRTLEDFVALLDGAPRARGGPDRAAARALPRRRRLRRRYALDDRLEAAEEHPLRVERQRRHVAVQALVGQDRAC